jgi:hypothetical protein
MRTELSRKHSTLGEVELHEHYLTASICHPRPSLRLFLGLCFLSALMMMGFLMIRSSHDGAVVRHSFNTSVKHSKG